MADRMVVEGRPPSIFPRIEAVAGAAPAWGPWTGALQPLDVIPAVHLARLDADRRLLASAADTAASILAQARRDAESHVAHVEATAEEDRRAWLQAQARRFDERTTGVLDALPDLVAALVRAVLGHTVETQPDLALHVSVGIALRVLQADLRRHVFCHPDDAPALRALADELQASDIESAPRLVRGDLRFETAQGAIDISGSQAMQALVQDLRSVLAGPTTHRDGEPDTPSAPHAASSTFHPPQDQNP